MNKILCTLLVGFFFIVHCNVAMAINDEAVLEELNDQKELLKKQREILEEQKKIVESQKAIVEAEKAIKNAKLETDKLGLPTGETEPKKGTLQADTKFGYFATLTSYATTTMSSESIAKDINKQLGKPGKNILLLEDSGLLKGRIPYLQIKSGLARHGRLLIGQNNENTKSHVFISTIIAKDTTINELPEMRIALETSLLFVSGALSAAADIAGYFKSNLSVKGQSINVNNYNAVSNLVKNMSSHTCYLPDANLLNVDSKIFSKYYNTLDVYLGLRKSDEKLKVLSLKIVDETKNVVIAVTNLQKELKKLKQPNDADLIKKKQEQIKEKAERILILEKAKYLLKEKLADSKVVMDSFKEFTQSATNSEKGVPSELILAAIWERIEELQITHFLNVQVLSSGGEAITVEETFGDGNTIYMGGSVVAYTLTDRNGAIIYINSVIKAADLNYDINSEKKITARELPITIQPEDDLIASEN